jgi:hypothetical protein
VARRRDDDDAENERAAMTRRISRTSLLFGLLAGAPFLAIAMASGLEARLFPVYEDMRVTRVEWRNGKAVVWGDARIARDCRYLGKQAFAGDPGDPAPPRERLRVKPLPDFAPPEAEATVDARGAWGPLAIAQPETDAGPAVFLRVTHRCHPLYTTHGVYLELPLEAVFAPPPP